MQKSIISDRHRRQAVILLGIFVLLAIAVVLFLSVPSGGVAASQAFDVTINSTITWQPTDTLVPTGQWVTTSRPPLCELPTSPATSIFPTIVWPTPDDCNGIPCSEWEQTLAPLLTLQAQQGTGTPGTPVFDNTATVAPTATSFPTAARDYGGISGFHFHGGFVGTISCTSDTFGTWSRSGSDIWNTNWDPQWSTDAVHCDVIGTGGHGGPWAVYTYLADWDTFWYKQTTSGISGYTNSDASDWTEISSGCCGRTFGNAGNWDLGDGTAFTWSFDIMDYNPDQMTPTPAPVTDTPTPSPTVGPTACVTPGFSYDPSVQPPVAWFSPPSLTAGTCTTLLPAIDIPLPSTFTVPGVFSISNPNTDLSIPPFGFCIQWVSLNAQVFGFDAQTLMTIFCFVMAAFFIINEFRS